MDEKDLCLGMAPNENAILIDKLQEMLERTDGEDKCVLCNTIEKLKGTPKTDTTWLMVILMIMLMSGFNSTMDDGSMRILRDTLNGMSLDKEKVE